MINEKIWKVLFVLSFVATLLVVHSVNDRWVEQSSFKFDLSENELYKLSDTTVEVASGLSAAVEITVFSTENEFPLMMREVLLRYSNLGSKIGLRYIDPYEDPVTVDSYLSEGVVIEPGDIAVRGAAAVRVYSIEDLYITNVSGTQITGLNAEQKLTSALVTVDQGNNYSVGFIDGHNERPSESLIDLFRKNSFEVNRGPLGAVLSEPPDLLVIASPSRDYLADEIMLLEEYLEDGGALMIFIEPSFRSLVELEGFLERRGIGVGNLVVYESEAFTGNNPLNIVPMYSPHPINRYFMDNRVFLTMPSARNFIIQEDFSNDVNPVLNSTSKSYGRIDNTGTEAERTETDIGGPFYLALSSTREIDAGSAPDRSRILVMGSRKVYGDDLLSFGSYGNADFLIQAIDWLAEKEDSFSIPPKDISIAPLNIQRGSALLLGIVFTLLIPSLILLAGLLVAYRRRES